jgi:hypothetical protein
MQTVHSSDIPSHAQSVHRRGTANGVIYTVPAGKTLVVLSAWVSIGQPALTPAAGSVGILVPSEDSGSNVICVEAAVGDNAGQCNGNSVSCCIRVPGGSDVSITVTGAAGATLRGGFTGYLDKA